ncbi:MAG: HNH endonuclease [Patescibacteria group bacterium]|nr:HNH endonuclease [Patescibacteria group bacterium]
MRFEILKRDNFKCVYCGNGAPNVKLHVDHRIALAKGGTNDPDNLVTACHICNAGKSDVLLEHVAAEKIPAPKRPMPNRRGRKYPTETFKAFSRKWRIFKRTNAATGSWYFLVERAGRRALISLKTPSLPTAIAKAKLLVESLVQDKFDEMRALVGERNDYARHYCDVETYLALYENTPTGENSPRSRHHFVLAFRRLLARVTKPPRAMDQLSDLFKQARELANRAIEVAPDNASARRIKRSFSSEVANAASVISERAVFVLKDKLTLPDFKELRQLIKHQIRFPAPKKTVAEYNPPSASILEATVTGWLDLPRNEFLAIGLALSTGMRRGEMRGVYDSLNGLWHSAADWNWFQAHNGYLWADGAGSFKDGTAMLRTQILDPFWTLMIERVQREGWPREGLIITGNRSEFDKNVSKFMKSIGWETRLHLHALRAWAGSLVFMKYGEAAACAFCRHADPQVTRESYGWMRQDWHTESAPVIVAGRPVEWVRA